MTYRDLARKLGETPFKPFRIRLADNRSFDVTDPWRVMIGTDRAIVVTHSRQDEFGYRVALDWKTISISHILDFSDIDEGRRPRKRKGA